MSAADGPLPVRIYWWVHRTTLGDGDADVQGMVGGLAGALASDPTVDVVPVRWCAHREAIVRADARWPGGPSLGPSSEAGVPLHLASADRDRLDTSWLLLPEAPVAGEEAPEVTSCLPIALDYARYYRLRIAAIVHDPASLSRDGAADDAARYLVGLAAVDLVMPVSTAARASLLECWRDARDGAVGTALERLVRDPGWLRTWPPQAGERPAVDWAASAREILAALRSAAPVATVCVVEATGADVRNLVAALESCGTSVQPYHWRSDSSTIVPGLRGRGISSPEVGYGQLTGLWGVLPIAGGTGAAEAMRIQDEARGLGLRLAVVVEPGRTITDADLLMIADADLVAVSTEMERDAVLAAALRTLPRISTLRSRVTVARDARALLQTLAGEGPRLAVDGLSRRPARIFMAVGTTASTTFNTGVQRVTRMLSRKIQDLGIELHPLKWDQDANVFLPLDRAETENLALWGGPRSRDAGPLPTLTGEWLLTADITLPSRPDGSTLAMLGRSMGMRVASVFYDLIPLRMPEIYPAATLDVFKKYWLQFAQSDIALPISWTVACQLRRYLADRGLTIPAIVPCPLAGDLPGTARRAASRELPAADAPLRLLAIGTWEPRKNYPRVLRGLIEARQRAPGRAVHLTIVGRRAAEFQELEAEISELAARAGDVDLFDHISDDEMMGLFESSDATIFASWDEGFGLPVLESLWRGTPCVCHDGSSLTEVAPGGGTMAIDMLDEVAIADAIVRLSQEDGLLARLDAEAVSRPIRDWDTYSRDVVAAIGRIGTGPARARPRIGDDAARPVLSCVVTTSNRAEWLARSLPQLIEAARPFGRLVEIVVSDDASIDETPEVIGRYADLPNVVVHRDPAALGMPGTLGAAARASSGRYVWLIGDDDLVIEGSIGAIVDGLRAHPDVEMAYLNYAHAQVDRPEQLSDRDAIMRTARSIGYGGPSRRVDALAEVAALSDDLFATTCACVFRRDHALRAYQQDASRSPSWSLLARMPSAAYALAALQQRPAYWVGRPAVVVNASLSGSRRLPLRGSGCMLELFDAAELARVDRARIDRCREAYCSGARPWGRETPLGADGTVLDEVSTGRLIEAFKHIDRFQTQLPHLRAAYEDRAGGRELPDDRSSDTLFASYGF